MQAGIYWPPSPAPFQNPSNPFSPQDHLTNHSIPGTPGTPGTPYLTRILNTATDEFTGESPAPFPATPGPSADQLVTASASSMDASTSDGDEGINGIVMEQYPLDFSEWFPCGTNIHFFSMDMDPNLVADMPGNQYSSSSEMPPPPRRRYKEKEETEYKKELRELESVHGADHPATIDTRLRLAEVFHDQARYRAAELAYRQAASTSQKHLGNNHESTLEAVNGLLSTFFYQGRYSIAETHYWSLRRRALNVLGREHQTTFRISVNLANLLSEIGKWNEAEPLEREVFEILSKLHGLEQPVSLCAMVNLAVSLLHLNRVEEGEKLLREAVRLQEEFTVDEYSMIWGKFHLAEMWRSQGRCEESETMYQEVLNRWSSLLGPEHPDTLSAMECLARVFSLQKRHAESYQIRLDVLATRLKVLGSSHPDTRLVQKDLVSVLTNMYTEEANLYMLKGLEF
jgi:tetratricopeptide (TPR) repeat protein